MTAAADGGLSVRRLLLTFVALAYAGLAVGSGLDRMSEMSPPLERVVPGWFRAQADRSASAVALSRRDRDRGLAAAARALDADPVDPRPAALLGAARLVVGDYTGAEAAFRVAAQFGWREPLTQLYWFEAALDSGDYARAAERLDALLRANPTFPAADELLSALAQRPQGRAELARRLAGNPSWRDAFLRPPREADLALLRRRAEIVVLAAGAGTPFGCAAPRPLAFALLAKGDRASAVPLWNAHCPEEPAQAGLSDGGFEQLATSDGQAPFGWARHPRGDLQIAFTDTVGGKALVARNTASVSRLVASQTVWLPPGRYVLRASVIEGGRRAHGQLAASFDCGGGVKLPANLSGDLVGAGQLITVGDCPTQALGLWLRPGTGAVTIDDVRLARAP